MNFIGIIVSYVYIFIIIASAKLVEKKGKEASRKYIHIMLANWWIIAMIFFDNVWFAAFAPATFVVINYLSCKKDLIGVMEREEAEKDGFGTVYYAISLLVLAIAVYGFGISPFVGLCGILTMGYGDGFAAIIGKNVKSKEYHIGKGKKTLAGSGTMLVISFIISGVLLCVMGSAWWIAKALIYAILATVIEAVSVKGTDNITVPLATALVFFLMI